MLDKTNDVKNPGSTKHILLKHFQHASSGWIIIISNEMDNVLFFLFSILVQIHACMPLKLFRLKLVIKGTS